MHYKLLLFTEKIPGTKAEIEDMLMPFNSNRYFENFNDDGEYIGGGDEPIYPVFTWDWWQIGGRYCGQVLAEVSTISNDGIYVKNINGVEILSQLFIQIDDSIFFETDWYGYIREGNCLRCDGAYVSKIKNDRAFQCFAFIGLDGEGRARESWSPSVEKYIEDREFDFWLDKQKEEALSKDAFMTVIDIHD